MQFDNLLRQIQFIKEIDKVKYIQRKTCLFNSSRHENDAEHSWHLAMMALVLAEYTNETIDILKVLKMLLIHDLVEIDAGDTFLFDAIKDHDNTEEELAAAKRIFGLLPTAQAKKFIEIWEEFEAGETNEAKFAKAMDRFEPALQNTSNNGGTWSEFHLEYDTVYNKLKGIEKGSGEIWEYTKNLLLECDKNGYFRKKSTYIANSN